MPRYFACVHQSDISNFPAELLPEPPALPKAPRFHRWQIWAAASLLICAAIFFWVRTAQKQPYCNRFSGCAAVCQSGR